MAAFGNPEKTFRIVVPQAAEVVGDWNTNTFSKWLEQRTGVRIEYQAVNILGTDGTPDLTKINAMISSGDVPDAFLIPFTPAQVSLYGQQGLFIALDDYIETYAPGMRQARLDYPDLINQQKSLDGKVHAFTGLSDTYHLHAYHTRTWINRQYLDSVGASVPESIDELREVLRLFKEQDPSGTGGMIPLAANSAASGIDRFFMGSFLYNPGGDSAGGWVRLHDGQVEFVADKPEWREALRYLRRLNDDGTLDSSLFTMSAEQLLEAGNQGRLGVVRAPHQGWFATVDDQPDSPWRDYVAVPTLKGPDGTQYASWDYNFTSSNPLVITNECSDPGTLVRWADTMLELTTLMTGYAGTQGENWDWAAEGEPGLNGEQAVWKSVAYPPPLGQGWSTNIMYYFSEDLRLAQYSDPAAPDLEKVLFEATKEYEPLAQPKDWQLPKLIFDDSTASTQAQMAVAVHGHVTQSMAKFATGALDIDSDTAWDDYVNQFNAIGLETYLDLYQKTYDSRPT